MIIDSLVLQSKLFLVEDMDIDIQNIEIVDNSPDKLVLKDSTSMIGIGGKLNMMVVISLENRFLSKLVELFMDGEEVDDDEKEEVYSSVTGETINTIIGLALPTFPNRGRGVTITPPITISDASNVKKDKTSTILSANIQTEFGSMSISAMGIDI